MLFKKAKVQASAYWAAHFLLYNHSSFSFPSTNSSRISNLSTQVKTSFTLSLLYCIVVLWPLTLSFRSYFKVPDCQHSISTASTSRDWSDHKTKPTNQTQLLKQYSINYSHSVHTALDIVSNLVTIQSRQEWDQFHSRIGKATIYNFGILYEHSEICVSATLL